MTETESSSLNAEEVLLHLLTFLPVPVDGVDSEVMPQGATRKHLFRVEEVLRCDLHNKMREYIELLGDQVEFAIVDDITWCHPVGVRHVMEIDDETFLLGEDNRNI